MKSAPPREIARTWLSEKKTVLASIFKMTNICQGSKIWSSPSLQRVTVSDTTLSSASEISISMTITLLMTKTKSLNCDVTMFCDCRLTCYEAEKGGNHDPHVVEAKPHLLLGNPLASHHNQITIFHCLSTNSHWAHHIPLHRVTVVHVCNFFHLFHIVSCWILVALKTSCCHPT